MIELFKRIFVGVLMVGISGAAIAGSHESVDWSQAIEKTVVLTEFKAEPNNIPLRPGQPYRMRFENAGAFPNCVISEEFFAAIDAAELKMGDEVISHPTLEQISVSAAGSELLFVPKKTGAYGFHCNTFHHFVCGMGGVITVTQ